MKRFCNAGYFLINARKICLQQSLSLYTPYTVRTKQNNFHPKMFISISFCIFLYVNKGFFVKKQPRNLTPHHSSAQCTETKWKHLLSFPKAVDSATQLNYTGNYSGSRKSFALTEWDQSRLIFEKILHSVYCILLFRREKKSIFTYHSHSLPHVA